MSKITWEYLAGFTDGEGSIGVVGKGTRITWGNTDQVVMDAMVKFLRENGFHVNYYSVEKKAPWKRVYMANICQKKEMLRIIDILQPMLITKVFQCENVRRWLLEKEKKNHLDLEIILKLRREGLSWANIAKSLHVKYVKIRNLLIDNGIIPSREYTIPQTCKRSRDKARQGGLCINCYELRGEDGTTLHCRKCRNKQNRWKRNWRAKKRCVTASLIV